ncbi:hypothetical protein EJ377_01450 [Chryseobacterium arthrosphaerae]|uniref:Uncharacterized protein n=1 Tax=Chryseobacterium arthrosphaerae TaxID=651561 RepID=A0A432DYJ2_9FLAO|nr:hypothetical protein EJ377_01450 [Chryseobacterium arthrosphaerae]
MLSIGIGFTKYTGSFSKIRNTGRGPGTLGTQAGQHPHRMAHYGYLVFRIGHPLNVFDSGLDDYLGNVIFWKPTNKIPLIFRSGKFRTLIRFGAFSSAFILQSIVPLIIIFWDSD